jgi:hypothetical protein
MRYFVNATDAFQQCRAQCLLMLDDEHHADYVARECGLEAFDVAEAVRLFREGGIKAITS